MNGLENIVFYQVYKRRKRTPIQKCWERKITKTKLFEEKIKKIKAIAAEIDQKLKTA